MARQRGRPKRRLRLWVLAIQLAALMLAIQAAVLGALAVAAARRWRRRAQPGFPYLESQEVEIEGNRLRLFSFGQDLYDAMLAAIDGARETIFVESFIWKNDRIGQRFKDHLARKAAEGVQVYVIFDNFGNLVVPHAFKQFPSAVHVLRYTGLTRPWHLLDPRRYALDHRKIVVVDGVTAFVGGYNIGSLYATEWRDTHVRIIGPEAAELAQSFIDFWNRYVGSARAISLRFSRRFAPAISLRTNDAARLIFPIRDMYIGAIDRAERHIYITNAYFIPDRVLLSALIDATRRGVNVQILLPWHSNHIAADWAARGFFATCLEAGIRIFAYKGVMIHAKTCTIDGAWSTLGTANLDRLSELGNHEINVEIFDEAFAREMEALFTCDKTNAFELTRDRWIRRPWYVQASELILSPLRPAL
ncbi:MAG TPA: phospholipase D-like domain-containing protein [Ktedonobacterales bacterium]|nr:phospholipase D-like domain-containing protein [Ktedonobacterales bacterium]